MNTPVILYNIDNKALKFDDVSVSNSFFVKSFQYFKIEIIEAVSSDNSIFSVKLNPSSTGPEDMFLKQEAKSFDMFSSMCNFGYTIYMTSDVIIKVTNRNGDVSIYNFKYKPINVYPDHYNDLIYNKNLPTFAELEPAIISENKADIMKRLLLDYRTIKNAKGTTTGITKFLNLIGFDPDTIKVYPEYIDPKTGIKTINPDKRKDIKTGDYHVLFDNFIIDEDDRYTVKNMPKALIYFSDTEELFDKLFYALSLANIYFTLPEQDIAFFGVNNSVNGEQYLSVAGNSYTTYEINPHNFNKGIAINLFNRHTQTITKHVIKNNLLKDKTVFKGEVKYILGENTQNNEMFLIGDEVFDNETYDMETSRIFGCLLNLEIFSHNTYVEYEIYKPGNELTKIKGDKTFIGELPVSLKFITLLSGEHKLNIWVTDGYNNTEHYFYTFEVSQSKANIDFNVYNSAELSEELNELNVDISSPNLQTVLTTNFILPLLLVPETLNGYNDVDITNVDGVRYLGINQKFMLPELNPNFVVDKSSDMPVDYMDNWIEVSALKLPVGFIPKLRYVDAQDLQLKLTAFDYSNENNVEPDILFVTKMIITETIGGDEVENEYVFISTIEPGINLDKVLFDIVLHNETTDELTSVYEDVTFTKARIPVNFDFPLFHREYDEMEYNHPVIEEDELINVESLFPRMTTEKFEVKLGDVIACVPSKNHIVGNKNVTWKITDAFTGEVLHETNDYMLKYRVKENTIYNVNLSFSVGNENYVLDKKSIISSFN